MPVARVQDDTGSAKLRLCDLINGVSDNVGAGVAGGIQRGVVGGCHFVQTFQVIPGAVAVQQLAFFFQCQTVHKAVVNVGLQHWRIVHHLT